MTRLIAFAVTLLVAASSLADAATSRRHRPQQHYAARTQPLIACTVLGCAPVRPECGSAPGRTFTGMPTGHDIVVCPPGVAPFR